MYEGNQDENGQPIHATEKQVNFLVKLGVDKGTAQRMSMTEASDKIEDLIGKKEGKDQGSQSRIPSPIEEAARPTRPLVLADILKASEQIMTHINTHSEYDMLSEITKGKVHDTLLAVWQRLNTTKMIGEQKQRGGYRR
jgi:hypothetical protein